ncbi:hypothetical protein ACFQZQ_00765 [Lysobacter koreensis]|uniref:Integrase n=1 Tax=Lysobacter koreensis TaxID=266122 RepID=A0ABW2YMX8_9GAMM
MTEILHGCGRGGARRMNARAPGATPVQTAGLKGVARRFIRDYGRWMGADAAVGLAAAESHLLGYHQLPHGTARQAIAPRWFDRRG